MHTLMDNGDLVHDSELTEYLRAKRTRSELTKKELATWVITGDPYARVIPPPLSQLHSRIVQALTIQEED